MDHPYFPILIVFGLGIVFALVFLGLSALIGPAKRHHGAHKLTPYECGLNPIGSARQKIDIKFSLVAMLFIVFDIETVFLYPWALLYRSFLREGFGLFMLVEMGVFIAILVVGLVYIWRKGALDWK